MAGVIKTPERTDWGTPLKIMTPVLAVFDGKIDLDPCGNKARILEHVERTIHPPKDGLKERWYGNVFVNPPYGPDLDPWMTKCATEPQANVIALLPASTSRVIWQETVPDAKAICFIKGRIKFHGATTGAAFSSALVLWTIDRYLPDRFAHFMTLFQMGMVLRP